MEKLLGKITSININGVELPFQSHTFSESFNVIDVTDTGTAGDGTETEVGRATRDLKIEGVLRDTLGKAVLAKQIIAEIPMLGDFGLTTLKYSETYAEVDLTDGDTEINSTEFMPTFAERKVSFDLWAKDTQEMIQRGTSLETTIRFAPGNYIDGLIRADSISVQGEVKGAVKYSVAGTMQGNVVETPNPLGIQCGGSAKTIYITYKSEVGEQSPKRIYGTGYVMSKELSGDKDSEVKLSISIKLTGAITEQTFEPGV